MSLYGGGVPWWRVVRADGALLPGHERRALERYRAEGTPLRTVGDAYRLDLRRARWDGQS
jgi:alkylated DNA nucleotide flippase Atl1